MKPTYLKPKYYIGISGHRNLKKIKKNRYKEEIKKILKGLIQKYPDKEVLIISPLADGADRLIVYAAIELGLRYKILLPMPIEYYEMDFDDESFNEFMTLFYQARSSDIVELCDTCTYDSIATYGKDRDIQYQKMGYTLVDRCNEMIFLWDEDKQNPLLLGGTEDILYDAKGKGKRINVIKCERA